MIYVDVSPISTGKESFGGFLLKTMNSSKPSHQSNDKKGEAGGEEIYDFEASVEYETQDNYYIKSPEERKCAHHPDFYCRTTTIHRTHQKFPSDKAGVRSSKKQDAEPPSGLSELPTYEPETRDFHGRTLIVIELQRGIPEETVQWLIKVIASPHREGGAQLRVMVSPAAENTGPCLHISATPWRLLATAEEMEIHKWNKHDELVPFVMSNYKEFLKEDVPDADSILTTAEKHRMVIQDLHLTDNLTEDFIPGFPQYHLQKGERIILFCEKKKIIVKLFPLHCQSYLSHLQQTWVWNFKDEHPVDNIRSYFGENTAFYFLYFDFYNRSLKYPALLALMEEILLFMCKGKQRQEMSYILFATANLFWVTLFLEFWKRKCNLQAFEWGRMCIGDVEEALPQFRGELRKNPITGHYERFYSPIKTALKMYSVSLPIVVFLSIIWIYFSVQVVKARLDLLREGVDYWTPNWYWYQCYGSVYSCILTIYRKFYIELSIWLSKWENHRMRRNYENSKIAKTSLLTFTITFCTLFYIAFVVQDFNVLENQLLWLLVFTQFYSHIVDAFYTYIYIDFAKRFFVLNYRIRKIPTGSFPNIRADKRMLDGNHPLTHQAASECFLQPTFYFHDYYDRLFQQFGLVFLFSPVCPLAAFWSYLNNLFEIRSVAFKLCNVHTKPTAIPSRGIGMWLTSFQFLGIVAASTNCALLAILPELRASFGKNIDNFHWAMIFVSLEHMVLLGMAILSITIPNISDCSAAVHSRRSHNDQTLQNQRLARLKLIQEMERETGGVCSNPCGSLHPSTYTVNQRNETNNRKKRK